MDPQPPPSRPRRGASSSLTTDSSSLSSHKSIELRESGEEFVPSHSATSASQYTATPIRPTRTTRTEPFQSLYIGGNDFSADEIVSSPDKARRAKEIRLERERKAQIARREEEIQPEQEGQAEPEEESSNSMSSRPRTGRGAAGRDLNKDVDQPTESDLLQRIKETLNKAQEFSSQETDSGKEIMETEGEIKSSGLTVDRHARLDASFRDHLLAAEKEKRAADEARDLLAMLQALVADREPAVLRGGNGTTSKGRKQQRQAPEPEVVVESPRPSPSDTRLDLLKRTNKGVGQRSSSVASSRSAAPVPRAEEAAVASATDRNAHLVIDAEVIYKYPGGATEDSGVGSMGIIKKIWTERTPVIYDIQDPEPDPQTGGKKVHAAKAKDLISIPRVGTSLLTFTTGTNVVAKYPDTDTFYKAEVRGFGKGKYTLMFEGEENNVTMEVDKRLVLEAKLF